MILKKIGVLLDTGENILLTGMFVIYGLASTNDSIKD